MCPLIRQKLVQLITSRLKIVNNLIALYREQLSFASYKQSPNVDGCAVRQYKEMLSGLGETRLLPFNASVKSPCFLSNKLTIQHPYTFPVIFTGAFYFLLCFIDCFPIRILAKLLFIIRSAILINIIKGRNHSVNLIIHTRPFIFTIFRTTPKTCWKESVLAVARVLWCLVRNT